MTNKDTRFQRGSSGNPKGRPLGSRNQSTIAAETLLDNEAEALTRRCIDLALKGDSTCLRLCLSHILPARRERAIELDLPVLGRPQDSLRAVNVILNAIGKGQVTPNEGASLTRLLEVHRGAFEVEVLERRLEALEAQVCGAN
jgi:chorismate-pyruvate lyase